MKNLKKVTLKSALKILWVLYALSSLIFWLPKVDQIISKDYPSISRYISLDDFWYITINDSIYQSVSLQDFRFSVVDKGDIIVMQRILPQDWGITEGALRLHVRQSAVRMYIDNEIIYEYGHDRMAAHKTVGSGFQFINFPRDYQGKTLKIILELSEDQAFTKLDSIRIYEWENVYRAFMTENRFPMFFGFFYIIFGLATCFAAIFALTFSLKYLRLLCISLFSICMGIWTICYYNVILIFSIPLYSISLLEYMSLYLSPLPLIIYMWEDVKKLRYPLLRTCYKVLLTVQIIATVWMLALHSLDIVHCAATLRYMHVLIIVQLIYFMLVAVMNLKSSRTVGRLYLIGILIVGGCISYDLIDYLSNRYFGRDVLSIRGVCPVGVMIFVFILIGAFYINLTQKIMQETERNSLIKSAYTDELTQLHNRRYCMEYINKIQENKEYNYTIVCFDLNNLKTVNDTYGHAKGDILIRSAAEVIAETFKEYGIVARMGGDEFIAVLKTSAPEKIAALVEQFRENVRKKNQVIKDLNMSIAFGYASGNEEERDIEKIYQIADNLMYENKKTMKTRKKNGEGI